MSDTAVTPSVTDLFKLRCLVATEALRNPDFCDDLKADPQSALLAFLGVDFSGVKVSIIEEDADSIVFPIFKLDDDLTAEQLEAIAGGFGFAVFAGVTAAGVSAAAATVAATAAVAGVVYTIGSQEGAW